MKFTVITAASTETQLVTKVSVWNSDIIKCCIPKKAANGKVNIAILYRNNVPTTSTRPITQFFFLSQIKSWRQGLWWSHKFFIPAPLLCLLDSILQLRIMRTMKKKISTAQWWVSKDQISGKMQACHDYWAAKWHNYLFLYERWKFLCSWGFSTLLATSFHKLAQLKLVWSGSLGIFCPIEVLLWEL